MGETQPYEGTYTYTDDEDTHREDDELHHENEFNKGIPDNVDYIPAQGMKFSSEDEVHSYYNNYARRVGFGIKKTSAKNSDDGKRRYFALACARCGKSSCQKNSFRPRPSIKTDCKARINVAIYEKEFVITSVHLDHNHDLLPGSANLFRCNKVVTSPFKRKLELNDLAGIPLNKNFHSIAVEVGFENLTFGEREARNHIAKARETRLGVGDAQALVNYFYKMQARDPGFFYAIDTDDECRIRNVFWADSRCKAAYNSFGDVITFDTTYLTNIYDMPFAPFVGVNHHGQSILFGCGLLSSEDTTSFVWLFNAWLTCMSGRFPNAIITDQCAAMKAAIAQCFPQSHHRLCLWHIMKKVPIKLGGFTEYLEIKKKLKRIVYQSLRVAEFEENWAKMILEFDLGDSEWLATLYEDRRRWVPVFVKHIFWAGMSTTQRSEGMNAFFDGYVHSQTTLKQFVEQYDHALKTKMKKEHEADFASHNSLIPTITNLCIEKQFQDVYTNDIFRKFQDELRGLIYCSVVSVVNEGSIFRFEVLESNIGKDGKYWNEVSHEVVFDNVEQSVECICRMFEYRGIICRHVIAALIKQKVNEIPARYILERWRKDIKRAYSLMANIYEDCSNKEQKIRSCKLRPLLFEVQQIGEQSDEKCNSLIEILEDAKVKLLSVESSNGCSRENEVPLTSYKESNNSGLQSLEKEFHTPLKVRTKGRPTTNRKQSKEETLGRKKKQLTGSQHVEEEKSKDQAKPKAKKRQKVSQDNSTNTYRHISPPCQYTTNQVGDGTVDHEHRTINASQLISSSYEPLQQNGSISGQQNFGYFSSLLNCYDIGDDGLDTISTLSGSQRQLHF